MRNRILSLTRSTIPYVKELMPLAQSLAGCILMQQLDYWFERKPGGFYKFLENCNQPLCRPGESWVEELGISAVEFRTTFDRFGIRYKSKSEFDRAPDKFQGKFYCSYHDKRAQLTWYFRNHDLLDQALDTLLAIPKATDTPENGGQNPGFQPTFPRTSPPTPTVTTLAVVPGTPQRAVTGGTADAVPGKPRVKVAGAAAAVVTGNPAGQLTRASPDAVHEPRQPTLMEASEVISGITETPIDFQKLQPQTAPDPLLDKLDSSSSSGMALIFPDKVNAQERSVLADLLAGCASNSRQAVLDELEGYIRAGRITTGIVPLARFLVKAVGDGKFVPNYGVAVTGDRAVRFQHAATVAAASASAADVAPGELNVEGLAMLPPAMRRRAEAWASADVFPTSEIN